MSSPGEAAVLSPAVANRRAAHLRELLARPTTRALLAHVALGLALALVVIRVQHTYSAGGRAAWSTATRAGAAECIKDVGVIDSLFGERCPAVGAPVGRGYLLGAGEALSVAVVATLMGMDTFEAAVPVGMAISVAGLISGALLFWLLGARWAPALLGSAVFATTPLVIGSQMFVGTGSGFILLPAYLAADAFLLRRLVGGESPVARALPPAVVGAGVAAYLLLRTWAIYLDGYTFIMSGVLLPVGLAVVAILHRPRWRRVLSYAGLFVVANAAALLIYRRSARGVRLAEPNLELFRGWGADVVTLLKPTDDLWWAAERGYGGVRSDLWGAYASTAWNYLGFVLMLLAVLGALVAFRRRDGVAMAVLVVGAVALVLCLGPALKLNAAVPPDILAGTPGGRPMPRGQPGAVELPWAGVFELPGLSSMRYPYRWSVLGRLAATGLATLAITKLLDRRRWFAVLGVVLMVGMVVELAPNMTNWKSFHDQADSLTSGMRDDVLPALRRTTTPGMRVVFVDGTPVGNEYLVSPMATHTDVTTYNAAGDKLFFRARGAWPTSVRNLILLPNGVVTMDDLLETLANHADAVVFVSFDLVRSINRWPTPSKSAAFDEVLAAARLDPDLQVTDDGMLTVVTLRDR